MIALLACDLLQLSNFKVARNVEQMIVWAFNELVQLSDLRAFQICLIDNRLNFV